MLLLGGGFLNVVPFGCTVLLRCYGSLHVFMGTLQAKQVHTIRPIHARNYINSNACKFPSILLASLQSPQVSTWATVQRYPLALKLQDDITASSIHCTNGTCPILLQHDIATTAVPSPKDMNVLDSQSLVVYHWTGPMSIDKPYARSPWCYPWCKLA